MSKFLLGIKKKFKKRDEEWDSFIKWSKLVYLTEIRTVDPYLNKGYKGEGTYILNKNQIKGAIEIIPKKFPSSYYLMFAMQLGENFLFDSYFKIKLLGCDLSDETRTSSLLNCGPLKGELQTFSKRLNKFGLLNKEDAKEFQKILLKVKGEDDPHADTNIWVLYEIQRGD